MNIQHLYEKNTLKNEIFFTNNIYFHLATSNLCTVYLEYFNIASEYYEIVDNSSVRYFA